MKNTHFITIDEQLKRFGASGFIMNFEWDVVFWFGDSSKFLSVSQGISSLKVHKIFPQEIFRCIQKSLQKITSVKNECQQELLFKDEVLFINTVFFEFNDSAYYFLIFHHKKTFLKTQKKLILQELNLDIHQLRATLQFQSELEKKQHFKLNKTKMRNLGEFVDQIEEQSLTEHINTNSRISKTESAIQSDTIIDFIREPLFTINSSLQIIRANTSFFKYFHVNEEEAIGNHLYEVESGFEKSLEFKQLIVNYLSKKRKIEDYELTITFASIGTRTILLNAKQVSSNDLKDIINVVAFEDITELKISRLLRDSEESYRVLADSAPVLLWVSETDGGVSFFNKSWLNFTGKSFHEQKGKGWITSIYPEDRDRVIKEFKINIQRKKEFKQEYRLRRNDGEYRWISVKGVPRISGDGDFLGFIGGCMDVNEQKNFSNILEEKITHHTQKLRDSQAFLKSILDMTQNLIYIYDFKKNKITFINNKAIEYTGFSPKEIEDSSIDIFTPLIHPEDLDKVLDMRQKLRENEKNTKMVTIEYQIKNKNGEYIYQLSRGLVFKRNKRGQPLQYIEVSTDITELKLANDLLLSKNKELEHRNKELASFTSIASHDLKEPLRKIQMFSKLLLSREYENVSPESVRFLERLDISASRMQQLIEDLISYSRTGNEKTTFIEADLNEVLGEILEDLKESLDEKKALIQFSNLPKAPIIRSQIQQLFSNLIGNSLKYSVPSKPLNISISYSLTPEKEKIKWNLDTELKFYKITFTDNGIGFPDIYKEKIFEPFQRLHGKDEYSGTGIGLAICKKIMHNHYGTIRAEGKEGEGSTFFVYLPY
jgi:PAS domain S-box-containing protein